MCFVGAIPTVVVVVVIMANPRKFSEKIALLNQKQAEETARFEQIMKEVSDVTSRVSGLCTLFLPCPKYLFNPLFLDGISSQPRAGYDPYAGILLSERGRLATTARACVSA